MVPSSALGYVVVVESPEVMHDHLCRKVGLPDLQVNMLSRFELQ